MAMAAVTFLVEQVKEVMTGCKDLISGAENELTLAQNELNVLKAALMDVAARKKKKEHMYRELERQIKEVVYEVEEALDICLAKAEAEAKSKGSFLSLKLLNPKRFHLANEVKSIREEKLQPMIAKAKNDFATVAEAHVDDDESGAIKDPRTIFKRAQFRQNIMVGLEDEVDTITGYLMTKMEELEVIPIIGIPGQGKTTLAWKVYEKEEICSHFPVRIWINISHNFNIRVVFLQILAKFMPTQSMFDHLTNEALAQTVCRCLQKERFLLVLDDVWSVDVWNQIKEVLPLNNGVSKVLITSRDKSVGQAKPHQLRVLTQEESWRLLQYEVFGNEEECPPGLHHIGQEIASKCDGVPMTVEVVGGILAGSSLSIWETVLKNMTDSLQGDAAAQHITDVVELSYRALPDDLRECFVYLGVFPEDYEIPRKMLSRLWISEGLILPRDGRSLEGSAEEKVNDLVGRHLLRVDKRNHMGKPKTFRVAKMIHAFCIAKSMDDNLFQEMRESKKGVVKPSASEVQQLHRLCFHSNLSKFLSTTPNGPRLRSFLCIHEQAVELEQQYVPVIRDGFPRLRILEAKCIRLHHFPSELTKLIHLRYLTMYIETLDVLPKTIAQLWNLVSLVVETKSRTITMKANVWRMIRLRYLKTKAAIVFDDKRWEGEARNLHTLNRLSPQSWTEVVSQRAANLKTLGICGELATVFENKFLANLHRLQKLKLLNSVTHELHGFPSLDVFPPNLSSLTLSNTRFEWKDMPTLAMIKTLVALKLKDNAFVGVSWKAIGYDFPSLQLLLIVNTDLVLWDASKETFPNLKFLVVKNCENLMEIPECVGAHLQRLELDHLRSSAVESAQRIEETKIDASKFEVQFNLNIGPPACV